MNSALVSLLVGLGLIIGGVMFMLSSRSINDTQASLTKEGDPKRLAVNLTGRRVLSGVLILVGLWQLVTLFAGRT
jgi:hypothetical protein